MRGFRVSLGIALLGWSALFFPQPVGAQQLERIDLADGSTEIRIENAHGSVSTPFSLLLTPDQLAGLRVEEIRSVPSTRDADSYFGVTPSTQGFLTQEPVVRVKGRQMQELRIHTLTGDGAVLRSLRFTIPSAGDGQAVSGGIASGSGRRSGSLAPESADASRISGLSTLGGLPSPERTANSPLSTGTWYRLSIPRTGIYGVTPAILNSFDIPFTGTPSDRIQIWGREGTALPELAGEDRTAFTQIPILVEDGGDGTFDAGDRIIFYAEGPDVVRRSPSGNFSHHLHDYAEQTYVFITLGDQPGERIGTGQGGAPSRSIQELEQFFWLEQDVIKSEGSIRSGRQWYGQVFSLSAAGRSQTVFTTTHPGWKAGSTATLEIRFVGRSTGSLSMAFSLNGTALGTTTSRSIASYASAEGSSGYLNTFSRSFTLAPSTERLEFTGSLIANESSSQAFIDWVRLRATASLHAENGTLSFFGPSDGASSQMATYSVEGFSETPVALDVTDPLNPSRILVEPDGGQGGGQGGAFRFIGAAGPQNQFILQTPSSLLSPTGGVEIANQNLAASADVLPEYLIITNEAFRELAQEWADHRGAFNGLRTLVATQEQILNEFSAGVPDPSAIRDFIKVHYDRGLAGGANGAGFAGGANGANGAVGAGGANGAGLQNVLLFGDASYDYRGLSGGRLINHVLTWQSEESLNRINSYGSDDFFGLLDDDEGLWLPQDNSERLDIGIGRWPVQTLDDARAVMRKTLRYEAPSSAGSWRTRFTFLADDDFPEVEINRDLHVLNADGTAEVINTTQEGLRVGKIYMLSYPVENTGAGRRVPQATRDMVRAFNEGSLVMNYSGHGNQYVLADERLYTGDVLPLLDNADRLSIFVTATCQFGRYDDSDGQSGAEEIVLLPDAGAVASFTTTRVVYTSSTPGSNNFGLNIQLTRAMLQREANGDPLTLGEIYRRTKNTLEGAGFNARKFALLGDPAARIALPSRKVTIDSINDLDLATFPDSVLLLRALDEVRLAGRITDTEGMILDQVDGELELLVYDARQTVSLPQTSWVIAGRCYMDDCAYEAENALLFSGRASVRDGAFTATFRAPREIRISQRTSRILAYAAQVGSSSARFTNPGMGLMEQTVALDASGSSANLRFSGVNTDIENDGRGPEMDLYLDSDDFVNGNLVGSNATLYVQLNDQTGINTSGTGVGHEIIATIDTDPQNVIVLNEYFEANLDDYRGGRIEYPLRDLKEGEQRLKVRAWDVFNNPSEQTIAFEVADSQELRIRNVANYPNPMNSFTRFFFEHNQPGTPLDVDLRIYTLTGRPVHHLNTTLTSSNSYAYIEWNGRDRDYDRLGNGTYLYVLRVGADTPAGRQVLQETEKLVILR